MAERATKCSGYTFCDTLKQYTAESSSPYIKGFKYLEVLDSEKMQIQRIGVTYQAAANATPVVLNYCPFCGGFIGFPKQ